MTFREDLQTIPSSSNPNPNIAPPHLMFAALDAGGARPTLPIINARGSILNVCGVKGSTNCQLGR